MSEVIYITNESIIEKMFIKFLNAIVEGAFVAVVKKFAEQIVIDMRQWKEERERLSAETLPQKPRNKDHRSPKPPKEDKVKAFVKIAAIVVATGVVSTMATGLVRRAVHPFDSKESTTEFIIHEDGGLEERIVESLTEELDEILNNEVVIPDKNRIIVTANAAGCMDRYVQFTKGGFLNAVNDAVGVYDSIESLFDKKLYEDAKEKELLEILEVAEYFAKTAVHEARNDMFNQKKGYYRLANYYYRRSKVTKQQKEKEKAAGLFQKCLEDVGLGESDWILGNSIYARIRYFNVLRQEADLRMNSMYNDNKQANMHEDAYSCVKRAAELYEVLEDSKDNPLNTQYNEDAKNSHRLALRLLLENTSDESERSELRERLDKLD